MSTSAELTEKGRRRKEGKYSIHISEAQLPKANTDKRHCCPVAGNSGKIKLLGQQDRPKHGITGHVHP